MSPELIKMLADIGLTATVIVIYGRILGNHENRIRTLETNASLRDRRPGTVG